MPDTNITNIYYDRQTQQCFLLTCYFINYRMSLCLIAALYTQIIHE